MRITITISCLFLFSLSALAKGEIQCLAKRDLIEGHCREILPINANDVGLNPQMDEDYKEAQQLNCKGGTKAYKCVSVSQDCDGYSFSSVFGFQSYQPKPATLYGISFPRNDRYLYRGVNFASTQFSVEKIIAAVLGDDLLSIGSLYQWRTSQLLTGEISETYNVGHEELQTDAKGMIDLMRVQKSFEKLKKCSAKYSKRDAARYASDLISKSFYEFEKKDQIREYFLEFNYPGGSNYEKFGNWGQFLLFGSVYSNVATWLGGNILMYNNSLLRSIDLNYLNHTYGQLWTYADGDNGEAVSPGVVTPTEVEGLLIAVNDSRATNIQTGSEIDYALIRYRFEGKDYLLVIDGKSYTCVTKKNDLPVYCTQKYRAFGLSRWNPSNDIRSLVFGPADLGKEAEVMAIIEKRPLDKESPKVTSKIFDKLKVSRRKLPKTLIDAIYHLRFFNNDKIFASRLVYPPSKKGISVKSATFGTDEKDNLYPYVANFCDGKDVCGFSLQQSRFFPEFVATEELDTASGTVVFSCDGKEDLQTVSANASEVLSLSCTDNAER